VAKSKTLTVIYKSDGIMVSDEGGSLMIESLHKDGGHVHIPRGEATKIGAALSTLKGK